MHSKGLIAEAEKPVPFSPNGKQRMTVRGALTPYFPRTVGPLVGQLWDGDGFYWAYKWRARGMTTVAGSTPAMPEVHWYDLGMTDFRPTTESQDSLPAPSEDLSARDVAFTHGTSRRRRGRRVGAHRHT